MLESAVKSSRPVANAVPCGGLSMVVTQDRVAYRGLLGRPTTRVFGALTVYVALDSPFLIKIGNDPAMQKHFAVVAPNVPHLIASPDKVVGDLLIEPEFVSPLELQQLPLLIESSAVRLQLQTSMRRCRESTDLIRQSSSEFDEFFLGRPLEPRTLDSRITLAIRQIRNQPCEQFFAASCAKLTGLSFSRFVHLFKEEIGMTFRAYCAWKRARALLSYVGCECSLTDLAMQTGYPDSTHFSHSIRRIYGLRPKDILAGSRRLLVASGTSNNVVALPNRAHAMAANTGYASRILA